jgi:hypothetical protein
MTFEGQRPSACPVVWCVSSEANVPYSRPLPWACVVIVSSAPAGIRHPSMSSAPVPHVATFAVRVPASGFRAITIGSWPGFRPPLFGIPCAYIHSSWSRTSNPASSMPVASRWYVRAEPKARR